MLKYKIATGTLGEDRKRLNLFSVLKNDYYGDIEKVEVRNEYTNDVSLYVGSEVEVVSTIDREDEFGETYPISVTDTFNVVQCDNVTKTFSFIAPKYQQLSITSLNIVIEDTILYLHFTFSEWHYFRSWDSYGINFIVLYPSDNGNNGEIIFERCQYVNDTELKWRYDADKNGIDNFMCSVFNNDTYELAGYSEYNSNDVDEKYVDAHGVIPEKACFTDELYLKLRVEYQKTPECWRWELYDKRCNDGSLLGVSAKRESYKFDDVNYTEEYFVIPLTGIEVPMVTSNGYDIYEEQNINDSFVKKQVEESKNHIVEMEKNVYVPVYVDRSGGTISYKPVRKIKFNLHFRKRDMDGWIVNPDGYWNGMDGNGLHDVVGGGGFQYFSYYGSNVDKGRQSDLLSYLGFTDTDVKYQKSRLKQSFLRLSFYDSMNRANQNLLCYATVFMDSGKLFAKKMRGADRKEKYGSTYRGIYVISDQTDNNRYNDAKVNTEPCLDLSQYTIEDVEERRLSSQIVVADRESEACSEGFYLYLWADNDKGAEPSDIYMRVEFNHAGYGRVIPFTMPYLDGDRIYSFKDVSDVWVNSDSKGWGVQANEKYSYIHFKYKYDKVSGKHVYFLDEDTYGIIDYVDGTPDEMEINLYEAKIKF